MNPPLLEVKGLTVRFRGLVAVDKVDLTVNKGDIFAVIGPNGAGKTTVFNAVTGIYQPTEGEVLMNGRDLQKQITPSSYVKWGLIGLTVGLLFLFFVADVDGLWSAVIKQNYRSSAQPFDGKAAWADFVSYMAAEPRTEQRAGRISVVSFDGQAQLGTARTPAEAEAKRRTAMEMARLVTEEGLGIEPGGEGFAIVAPDGRVLDELSTREQAETRVAAARHQHEASARARTTRVIAFLLGIILGFAGGWAVWRQTRRTPTTVALRGIARTFQNIRLFQQMTVLENVLVGMDRHLLPPEGRRLVTRLAGAAPLFGLIALLLFISLSLRWQLLPPSLIGVLLILFVVGAGAWIVSVGRRGQFQRRDVEAERVARARAVELLEFVGLEGKDDEVAKNLAYGNQRRLEIARALATMPELLLLDEPAAGMNPAETVALMKLIQKIRASSVTVVLIEHHMRVVMGISDRIAVLVYGKKIAEGTPEEIRGNPQVIEAYLGTETLG